jgi:hypothetical protein
MARLSSEFIFTGSLGELSAYRMRGVEGIIVRTKGGPSKKQIKTSPKFANTRRLNAEFGGRATATKWIMKMLRPLKPLADYNIAGPLNALMKPIQALDVESGFGKRSIYLSKNPGLLPGFSLNRQTTFDSVMRASLPYIISREDRSARIEFPALIPGINLHTNNKHPMYSFVAAWGVVPDLVYTQDIGYHPVTTGYDNLFVETIHSEWFPALKGSPATTLALKFETPIPDNAFSLMLTVGIRFGVMQDENTIKQVKYAGCAKVLAMA